MKISIISGIIGAILGWAMVTAVKACHKQAHQNQEIPEKILQQFE